MRIAIAVVILAGLVWLMVQLPEADASEASSADLGGQGGDLALPTTPDLALAAVADLAPADAVDLANLGSDVKAPWTPPAAAAPYLDTISQAELKYALPEGLLARTLYEESRYRPEIIDGSVKSSAGAIGIAQFMPKTAAAAGIDPTDPFQAIPAAAAELRAMFNKFGSWTQALAAYNWGQGNLGRQGVGAEPAETRRYVAAIAGDVGIDD